MAACFVVVVVVVVVVFVCFVCFVLFLSPVCCRPFGAKPKWTSANKEFICTPNTLATRAEDHTPAPVCSPTVKVQEKEREGGEEMVS